MQSIADARARQSVYPFESFGTNYAMVLLLLQLRWLACVVLHETIQNHLAQPANTAR